MAGPPRGCTGGKSKSRAGRLHGALKLKLGGSYFHTVRVRSLKATLTLAGNIRCTGGGVTPPTVHGTVTSLFSFAKGSLSVNAYKPAKGRASVYASQFAKGLSRSVSASISRSAFSVANDFSSATVNPGGSPFSGLLRFKASSTPSVGGGTAFASGKLSAPFAINFKIGGAAKLPAGTSAQLTRSTS